jgi:transposase
VPLGRLSVFGLPHRALLCESKRLPRNHNRFIQLNIFLDRLLERGILVRQGLRFLRSATSGDSGKRIDVLSPRMIRIVEELSGDWRRFDERIDCVTEEIEQLAHGTESCRQLMTVPGIGPIIASAMVAALGNGAAFAKGRDLAAWLGLVPKQMSTGDRTILGRISKRGNRYLRTLFMQGARVILLRPVNWAKHSFGPWLTRGETAAP